MPEIHDSALDEVNRALARLSDQTESPGKVTDGDLERMVEALLFLSPDPVSLDRLADACEVSRDRVEAAITSIRQGGASAERGIVLREVAGGFTFATHPMADRAARRLLGKPKSPSITQAQLEILAIAAYVGPVSRPEIARIRGVNSESTVATLVDRGLLEECGRSRLGAIEYRTTGLMERQFGLRVLADLPSLDGFDATLEDREKLRERLMAAGDARSGRSAESVE